MTMPNMRLFGLTRGVLAAAQSRPVTTLYTLAADSTLFGISGTFGTDVATRITNLQGSLCTWNSSFSYNTAPTINPTNISLWASPGSVCVVWSNNNTSSTKDLATQIINAGGRVVSLVFGAINFISGGYSISEVVNMPAAFRVIASSDQANLPSTTVTVLNVPGFADLAGQTFSVNNYYSASGISLTQPLASTFLTSGGTPYGAYYKLGTQGHAMIMLWPGSAFGYSGATDNRSIFMDIVARASRMIA